MEAARNQASNPNDGEPVAREATSLLASRPVEEIVAAEQVLRDLMVDSYSNPLWAAAYLANGGCSDDGFDYFRGWLIAQGCEVFERVVADPDALAELPIVQASAADGVDLEGEDMLGIAWNAHIGAAACGYVCTTKGRHPPLPTGGRRPRAERCRHREYRRDHRCGLLLLSLLLVRRAGHRGNGHMGMAKGVRRHPGLELVLASRRARNRSIAENLGLADPPWPSRRAGNRRLSGPAGPRSPRRSRRVPPRP
ncbi:DUF4240 domain-containing protein [Streptomyces virginiae]|uniref:DUF4240 domain-containing protein n=1 Tax=Streptomyces virginiae TaxID=1961 RepID=UPI003F6C7E73